MLSLGRKAGTPSYLVVFPLWEGVEGEDLNSWVLLPSATLPGTDGPLGAGTSEINLCLLASVCNQCRYQGWPFLQMPSLPYATLMGVHGIWENPCHVHCYNAWR